MLGMGILDSCEQGQMEAAERSAEEARDYRPATT